jgi:hypothetical protein
MRQPGGINLVTCGPGRRIAHVPFTRQTLITPSFRAAEISQVTFFVAFVSLSQAHRIPRESHEIDFVEQPRRVCRSYVQAVRLHFTEAVITILAFRSIQKAKYEIIVFHSPIELHRRMYWYLLL